jgi:hypothetical protein
VGRRDADQLRVAPGRDEPEAVGDRRSAVLPRIPERHPHPVAGLGFRPDPRRRVLRGAPARDPGAPDPESARAEIA